MGKRFNGVVQISIRIGHGARGIARDLRLFALRSMLYAVACLSLRQGPLTFPEMFTERTRLTFYETVSLTL